MAAVAAPPQTPQRPVPGGYTQTPAPSQAPAPAPSTIFAQQINALRNAHVPGSTGSNEHPPNQSGPGSGSPTHGPSPIDRAARTINDALHAESLFPELEQYVGQGTSQTYDDLPSPAWQPFQKLKLYDLPLAIIQQANQTSTGLQMGCFPRLRHCWAVMDNCLYLWDYTVQNAELIGFEQNPHPITAVKLVKPRPGVFVKDITDVIVVATSENVMLLGVAMSRTETGARNLVLYNTKMSIPTRGLNVQQIAASEKTGRIFFLASEGEDIYEFQYQQEEGWFRGKTARVCHTRSNYDLVPAPVKAVGSFIQGAQRLKRLIRIVVDDSRGLLYTLSDTSEIKVWAMKAQVTLALLRPLRSLLQASGHFVGQTPLLTSSDVRLVGLDAIPATEAAKVSVVATTNTGCRLYLSAARGYGVQADGDNPPNSMQILHVRFPPKDPNAAHITGTTQPGQQSAVGAPYSGQGSAYPLDANTRVLDGTEAAQRFPPGYFLAALPSLGASAGSRHRLFLTAPDFAKLKNRQDSSPLPSRFSEFGQWIDLPSWYAGASLANAEEYKGAAMPGATSSLMAGGPSQLAGFGNELALQFDSPSAEIAIMTGVGVQTLRRRRLVDVFAATLRYGTADSEGEDGGVKRFVRHYGRGETAATALAVACGKGMDVTGDIGGAGGVTDPEVVEGARKAFIEQGGRAEYDANVPGSGDPVDAVKPSPRHEGLALYVSRLVRGLWKSVVIKDAPIVPGQPPRLIPGVKVEKLREVQRDLMALKEFLERNKSFIEGLSGAGALSRVGNRAEELALQGEHRAMDSMMKLLFSIVEGISFVLVLFDERVEDILALLSPESKTKARELTFEALFVSAAGRELAKELVKAIVNRNIANGSNVDTVAEALRRRCGTFCSSDDVVIFKAQEQVKRASEAGGQSESGRVLLNESARLFGKVAKSLGPEHLTWAVQQYISMAFYAGAVQLCLTVAGERDKARRGLGWLREGMNDADPRKADFEERKKCYDLVFEIIQNLDAATEGEPQEVDGRWSLAAKRRAEAYEVVNGSEDAVFQTCLYDWYSSQGKSDRLLDVDSPFVVEYLRQRAPSDRYAADLLWRYYAHKNDFLSAASTQLDLAKGFFELSLEERISYLSRARTNASTRQTALLDSRQSKHALLRAIGDLLDVAAIQDDLLQRMKAEPRLTDERRDAVLQHLEYTGGLLTIGEMYNQYTDQAGYHDLNLHIYHVADHRNPADVKACWEMLIQSEQDRALAENDAAHAYERVGIKVTDLARKVAVSEAIFPIGILLPMLERYALEPQEVMPQPAWVIDLFLDLEVSHETLLSVMEGLYYSNEHPFTGSRRKVLAVQMVYLIQDWERESVRRGERMVLGGEESATMASECLASLLRGRDLEGGVRREAEGLEGRISSSLR